MFVVEVLYRDLTTALEVDTENHVLFAQPMGDHDAFETVDFDTVSDALMTRALEEDGMQGFFKLYDKFFERYNSGEHSAPRSMSVGDVLIFTALEAGYQMIAVATATGWLPLRDIQVRKPLTG